MNMLSWDFRKFFTQLFTTNHPETSIQHGFDQIESNLTFRTQELCKSIDDWGQKTIELIKNHVSEQKNSLDHMRADTLRSIKGIREAYLAEMNHWNNQGDQREIDVLINKCSALRFSLAKTLTSNRSIEFLFVSKCEENSDDFSKNDGLIDTPQIYQKQESVGGIYTNPEYIFLYGHE